MTITDASYIDITFSYPKSDIATPNGYFEWRDSTNSKYNKYIVSNFYFDIKNHILVVKHINNTGNLYLIFDTVNTTNSDSKLTNLKIIHLNSIIGNNLLNIPKLETNLKYGIKFYSGYDDTTKYVYFNKTKLSFDETNADNNITDIPSDVTNISTKLINAGTSANLNTFRKGMFINDEMECGESTIGSETIAKNKYATTVAGNLGITIGVGIIIIVGVIATITIKKDNFIFERGTSLFDGWSGDNPHPGYNVCWALLLLLSIICFIAYGGVMLDEEKSGRDSTVSGLLATAIITLILFIFMIGYKGLVLTPA